MTCKLVKLRGLNLSYQPMSNIKHNLPLFQTQEIKKELDLDDCVQCIFHIRLLKINLSLSAGTIFASGNRSFYANINSSNVIWLIGKFASASGKCGVAWKMVLPCICLSNAIHWLVNSGGKWDDIMQIIVTFWLLWFTNCYCDIYYGCERDCSAQASVHVSGHVCSCISTFVVQMIFHFPCR